MGNKTMVAPTVKMKLDHYSQSVGVASAVPTAPLESNRAGD